MNAALLLVRLQHSLGAAAAAAHIVLLILGTCVCTLSSEQHDQTTKQSPKAPSSGCRDGTTDGFQDAVHPKVAACQGSWQGHIKNASSLCAYGWRVCGWESSSLILLKRIGWKEASRIPGCYAINAAQDDDKCRPCLADDIAQDDLAGIGSGCAHSSFRSDSCISGGRIDASCCIDAHFGRACQFQPGLTTGVLCCRLPGFAPRIIVHPQTYVYLMVSGTFVLSCRAVGAPQPTIQWLHNGLLVSGDRMPQRISVFESAGYLIISDAQPSDSGLYQCLATNRVGIATSTARLLVAEYRSGCSDGTTEGLFGHEDIHACKGRWEGHVKKGRTLCASGWQVCSPRHINLLKELTWTEATVDTDGCYAYNSANSLNTCSPCYDIEMAGIGKRCGSIRGSRSSSCLAEGRIDVYSGGGDSSTRKCRYSEGLTSGVLCCRRPEKWQQASHWSAPKCTRRCRNGGVCIENGTCLCQNGYKGSACETPVCSGGCIPNSSCIKPQLCQCNTGYIGPSCNIKDVVVFARCRLPCLNGGRCISGRCKCPKNFKGWRCQVGHRPQSRTSAANRTEKKMQEIA